MLMCAGVSAVQLLHVHVTEQWEERLHVVKAVTGLRTPAHPAVKQRKMNLSDWVAQGHDHASTSAKWPTDEHLVGWAKAILGIEAAQ